MSSRQSFCLITSTLFLVLLLPVAASAQFRDLNEARSKLERGFGSGDVDAIVSGIASDNQVQLQFPGLVDKSGFFDRDQAADLLDGLFNKVKPSAYDLLNARKVSAEGLYHMKARWTINSGAIELYITLQQKDEKWSVVSVRSAYESARLPRSAEPAPNNSSDRSAN
jgi:hypothetical protein